MKTILLMVAIGCSYSTFAQKKLIAQVGAGYSENGAIGPIDSTAYTYQDWRGSLESNEAIFGLNSTNFPYSFVPIWRYEQPVVNFTTLERWDGSYYPLSNYSVENKLYNANFECISNSVSPQNIEYRYEYTNTGEISLITGWIDELGTISDSMSIISTYDNFERLIMKKTNYFDYSVFLIDSFIYNGNNLNVSEFKRYSSDDSINFHLVVSSTMLYSGNEITSGDVFQDTDTDPLTPLDFVSHAEYTWQSNLLTNIDFHSVNTGVIDPYPTNTVTYDYNGLGQLSSITHEGELQEIHYLTYDSDDFLIKWEIHVSSSSSSSYYLRSTNQWHFDATNSIDENTISMLTIYPNPTYEMLYLDAKNVESLKVYSLSGQLIKEATHANSIPVAELESGMYYLEATIGNKQITKNFIKQ